MHSDHEGGAEKGGQKIGDGDRGHDGNEKAGDEDVDAMRAAHRHDILDRPIAQRREFEIAATEQIGVGDEEDDGIEAGHEQQNERGEMTSSATPANFAEIMITSPSGGVAPIG